MDKPFIAIRPGNPTYDEGLSCGHYLNEAAEGFFRFMLGCQFTQIIAKAYTQPNHSYSFQNVSFAQKDSSIVGMALGFTSEQYRRFSDKPLKEAAGSRNFKMKAVKMLFAPMFRIIETIDDGDFYLLAMAIDKDLRGKGVGSSLMKCIKKRARANGSARISLDVSGNNKSARQIYENWGMTIESQWPKRLPLPRLRFYRMVKEI